MEENETIIQEDNWSFLKNFTKARIALGNVGGALPLNEVLDFRLAHAKAKDAIFSELAVNELSEALANLGVSPMILKSNIENRNQYLTRPDLGRTLDAISSEILREQVTEPDIVFVLVDGLSANAVNNHALAVLERILPLLKTHFTYQVVLVKQGRVAIGDEVGELVKAKFTALFIGERPGLSSPQSMGIYTTYAPQKGLTDERRNCISNIHPDGLSYEMATQILYYLIEQSFLRKISGVDIKVNLHLLG
ncbi:MAG: ethanolamine ammonia-lyase subunit EutC [Spirosomataceae bacterium]